MNVYNAKNLIPKEHQPCNIQAFKAPLVLSKDSDVMNWISEKVKDVNDPASKLWELIRFAANSNGRLRSDTGVSDPSSPEAAICEYLLSHPSLSVANPNKATSGEGNQSPSPEQSSAGAASMAEVQSFLLKGQRDKAVKAAIEAREYPMAFLIASICDRQKYQEVVKSYVDEKLAQGSPLHTLSLIFSGQSEGTAKPCVQLSGPDAGLRRLPERDVMLDNWMSNLAAVITNRTRGWDALVGEIGDRLAASGDFCSSHFCHMVSGANIEPPSPKAKLVLLGTDHTVPANISMVSQDGIAAFQRTEAFEWAKRKGNAQACIPSLQAFKLMYAMCLADFGYTEVSLKYVKSVKSMISRSGGAANKYPPSFITALDIFEDRLCVMLERGGNDQQKDERKSSIFGRVGGVFKDISLGSIANGLVNAAALAPPRRSMYENAKGVGAASPYNYVESTPEDEMKQQQEQLRMQQQLQQQRQQEEQQQMQRQMQVEREELFGGDYAAQISTVHNDAALQTQQQVQEKQLQAQQQQERMKQEQRRKEQEMQQVELMGGDYKAQITSAVQPNINGSGLTIDATFPPNSSGGHGTNTAPHSTSPRYGGSIPIPPPALKKSVSDINMKAKGEAKKSPPNSTSSKRGDSDLNSKGWLGNWIAKKLNPESNVVTEMGEVMEAYFDEDLKTWVFPGEDPVAKAAPLAPPPTAGAMRVGGGGVGGPAPGAGGAPGSGAAPPQVAGAAPAAPPSVDPLAAMMAPPPRNPSGRMTGAGGVRSRYADPMASMGFVSQSEGSGQPPTASRTNGGPPKRETPKYAVFSPT